MEKKGKRKACVNWGAVAVFLQAVERKAGILLQKAGRVRDGEADLEEREFERRMANIYWHLNMAWNSRRGEPFPSEPEEMARRGRFPEGVSATRGAKETKESMGRGKNGKRGGKILAL